MYCDKLSARREIKAKIEGLTQEYIEESNTKIFKNFLSLPEYLSAETVFIYYSVGREPDTGKIIADALSRGKTVALPYSLDSGEMELRRLSGTDTLIQDRYGIPTPPDDAERLAIAKIELAVIPALTFDMRLYRMGHGGGYYDRFLGKFNGFSVGLARERLIADILPTESHDRPVDCLITEKGIAKR
jgi:5-formyltetrahydrofolate cyclo-ligase